MLKNKLGMSPVIATALLLVVAVIALVGFQAWYTSYQTKILTNVESDKGVEYISNSGISNVIGDEIYFVNPKSTNLTLTKLEIGDTNCNVSQNLSPGLNRININNCDNNISPGLNTVTVFTDDRIFSENFFI